MNDESERMYKEAIVPNFRYYRGICLEVVRKSTKNFSHDGRSSGRDLNPVPPEYEAGVLTTRLQFSISRHSRPSAFSADISPFITSAVLGLLSECSV
jgi:hypothetical protein